MKRKQTLAIVIVCLLALAVVVLRYAGGFWPLRVLNDQIFNPIGSVISSAGRGIKSNSDMVFRATELSQENKRQASEIVELKKQLSALKEIANENDQLRNQLNFNQKLSFDLTAARVVGSEATSLRKYITIDRGSTTGVARGMAVVSSGVLVGVIDSVNDFSSTVFLATDPEFRLRAIGQDGRAQGILRGQLGQGYLFERITQSESIAAGELVITAGSGLVPKGILVGQVDFVTKSDNAVFQSAQLRPLVNFPEVEVVFVVKGLKQ